MSEQVFEAKFESSIIVRGIDGKSAYEIWLEQGNTGTEQDFLDSLSFTYEDFTEEQLNAIVAKVADRIEAVSCLNAVVLG